jgi:hypothetical protein
MVMAGRNLLADEPSTTEGRDLLGSAFVTPKQRETSNGLETTEKPQKLGTLPMKRGIAQNILGSLGDVEAMFIPGEPKYGETMFPTSKEVGQILTRAGVPESVGRQQKTAETAGELFLPMATGAQAVYGLGRYGLQKTADLAKKAKDYYSLSKGSEAEKLANALKTNLSSKAEDVILGAEKAMEAPRSKLAAVGKAQEQLGGRETIAGARQKAREQDVSNSLNTLSPSKNVLAEDVGGVIQPEGQKNLESLKQTRQQESIKNIKDPAFESARDRYARGDSMATNPNSADKFNETIGEIQTQIERTPEPYRSELRKRLGSLRGEEVPLSEGEQRAEAVRASIEGRPPKTTKNIPMSLDQAEFMRRILKDKNLGEAIGAKGMDVSRMNDLGDKLLESMKAYEPRVGEYLSTYKETSEPITRALAGRGKALTDVELQAEEDALFSSDKTAATNYYLNGTQERAERLLNLIGGKKEQLSNSIRGFFRTKMDGMSATQANQFVRENEGFLRVFPELRQPMESIVKSKQIAETAGGEAARKASSAATRLSGEAKTAEAAIKPQEKIAEKFRIYQSQLNALTPKDSVSKAKELIDGLRKDKLIDNAHYVDLLNKVERIKTEYGDSAKAAQNVQLLLRKELIYGGLSSIGIGGGLGVGAYYGLKALGE